MKEETGWGGRVWLSGRGRIFEKNILNNSGMIYLLFNGKRSNLVHCLLLSSFLLGSETLQGKFCIYAYYDIRNLIEIRGQGVKTIALPLDH